MTPGDGTQVPPRTWAWTGDGVLVQAAPDGSLRDRDLATAIDGVGPGPRRRLVGAGVPAR